MSLISNKSGISEFLPEGAVSNIPWRRKGARYTQNEIYFDIHEEVNAIVDANGRVVSCEVRPSIHVHCRNPTNLFAPGVSHLFFRGGKSRIVSSLVKSCKLVFRIAISNFKREI